jgi:hypothetical protein
VHLLLQRSEVLRDQHGRLDEVDLPLLARIKHHVDYTAMEVHTGIQRAVEALDKAHRPLPPAHAAAALTQLRFDHPQEDVQHRAEPFGGGGAGSNADASGPAWLSREEEQRFLAPGSEASKAGGLLVIAPIRAALA